MNPIKFSENYWKLSIIGYPKTAKLTAVKEVNLEDLNPELIEMDTRFFPGRRGETAQGNESIYGHYPLPTKGKYLALGFGDGHIAIQNHFGVETGKWQSSEERKWCKAMTDLFESSKEFMTLRSRYGGGRDKLPHFSSKIGEEFKVVMKQ